MNAKVQQDVRGGEPTSTTLQWLGCAETTGGYQRTAKTGTPGDTAESLPDPASDFTDIEAAMIRAARFSAPDQAAEDAKAIFSLEQEIARLEKKNRSARTWIKVEAVAALAAFLVGLMLGGAR